MELISLKDLKAGMVIAKPIYNSRSVTLVPAGAILTESMINKLSSKSNNSFEQYYYVETKGAESVIIEDKISENLRSETASFIRNKQIEELMKQAKIIKKHVIDYNINSIDYYDTRNEAEYISRHSVNVAIIACVIAKSMGFNDNELYEITLAGLLHDFAKISNVDDDVINFYISKLKCKEEEVTPILTYAYLKDTDYFRYGAISSTLITSILYHHENENGTGYYKKDGEMIRRCKYSAILHVADIYDTLANNDEKSIKTDLPEKIQYFFLKEGVTPKTIINFFMADCSGTDENRLFDREVVKHFLKYISVYTKGKRVLLSNGDEAIVNRNTSEYIDRPEVVVVEGSLAGETINLSSDKKYLNLLVTDYAKKM